ncbi:hypothetical protein VPDG_00147 [Vibrio phage henriette 12B8]|uniref:immunity to superinfection n=1 Tax=Vibrio phage henriette 12B8 TaxID=573174 RepID=UPI0002C082CA|nr:immunity to superinfection [Vibrio phage henriette 12B8]AGG58308.1 hypothetical protein VPDG_00147 [Vibrio phage henriette 12B8]
MRNRDRGISSSNTFKGAQRPQPTIERTTPQTMHNSDGGFMWILGGVVSVIGFGYLAEKISLAGSYSTLYVMACIALYFLPAIVALVRNHKNCVAIIILNVFLGWTFLGWVVSLVWSFTSNKKD